MKWAKTFQGRSPLDPALSEHCMLHIIQRVFGQFHHTGEDMYLGYIRLGHCSRLQISKQKKRVITFKWIQMKGFLEHYRWALFHCRKKGLFVRADHFPPWAFLPCFLLWKLFFSNSLCSSVAITFLFARFAVPGPREVYVESVALRATPSIINSEVDLEVDAMFRNVPSKYVFYITLRKEGHDALDITKSVSNNGEEQAGKRLKLKFASTEFPLQRDYPYKLEIRWSTSRWTAENPSKLAEVSFR